MKKSMIVSILLMMLGMSFVFTGCGKNTSNNEEKACTYNCKGVGFGFELPEGVKLTNGFIDMTDQGDVDYKSGVYTGWPVYIDMSQEEYEKVTEASENKPHVGFSFSIICVKDVNSEEEAKDKCIAVAEKINAEFTEADKESLLSYRMIHQENGYVWLAKSVDRTDGIREECKAE